MSRLRALASARRQVHGNGASFRAEVPPGARRTGSPWEPRNPTRGAARALRAGGRVPRRARSRGRGGARGVLAGGARSSPRERPGWRRRAPCARPMGRLTEAAAAGGGAAAASSAGPPPTPLPLSATSPGCTATMAFSEEDGTNGASEASEEREAPSKRRRLGWAATAWLTFYNIAMTAGYVRPEGGGPALPQTLPARPCPRLRARGGDWVVGGARPRSARVGRAEVCAGRGAGRSGRGGRGGRPWGTRAAAVGEGRGRRRRRLEWSWAGDRRAHRALPNTVHGVAAAAAGAGRRLSIDPGWNAGPTRGGGPTAPAPPLLPPLKKRPGPVPPEP